MLLYLLYRFRQIYVPRMHLPRTRMKKLLGRAGFLRSFLPREDAELLNHAKVVSRRPVLYNFWGKRRSAQRLWLAMLFTRPIRGRLDETALQTDGRMGAHQRRRGGREVAGSGMING